MGALCVLSTVAISIHSSEWIFIVTGFFNNKIAFIVTILQNKIHIKKHKLRRSAEVKIT